MKEFMYLVFAIMVFGLLFGGCVKPNWSNWNASWFEHCNSCEYSLYDTKRCHQIGGSFIKNEVYIACTIYEKK